MKTITKILTTTIITAVFSLGTLASFAQENPDYYYPNDYSDSQMNNQSNGRVGSPIYSWCNQTLRELREVRSSFVYRNLIKNYQNLEAVNLLLDRLIQSNQNPYQINPPLTQRLIERGITMTQQLMATLSHYQNGVKGINYFLESYLDLIFYVADNIDLPYYTPGNCGYCNHANTRRFDKVVVQMAKSLIELANNKLLMVTQSDDSRYQGETIYPIGPAMLYLKVQEMMSYFVSSDLRNSIFANYYSCSIMDLNKVHRDLRAFNVSTQAGYSVRDMIYQTYFETQNISWDLQDNRCH